MGQHSYINGSVQGTQLGEYTNVGEGTDIVDSIIMNNAYINKNCKIDQCILMDECNIDDNIVLPPGSIVGPRCNVDNALVQHSIRCFLQHLWDKSEIYARFASEEDKDYIT